jgi:hypothetical protein
MERQPEHDGLHDLDEDGVHDPEECEECLLSQAKLCICRCGRCCECLIIEVSMRDGDREPLIQKLASPIYDDMSGVKEQIGWLLNGEGGPCVFFDRQTRLCMIHETRPLCCRLYDCDESDLRDVSLPPQTAEPPAGSPATPRNCL